jgi:hypothetical protein
MNWYSICAAEHMCYNMSRLAVLEEETLGATRRESLQVVEDGEILKYGESGCLPTCSDVPGQPARRYYNDINCNRCNNRV